MITLKALITLPQGEIIDSFISEETLKLLEKNFQLEMNEMDRNFTPEELYQHGRDADILITGWGTPSLKSAGFYEKYGSKINPKSCITTYIKNDANDIEVIIDEEKVMLCSSKKINLMDAELNEFLLAYKNMFNKKIRVVLCENYTGYDY